MANVTGFDPAPSGQQPVDQQGNTVPVGVWGDSDIGVGVFATSGAPPPNPFGAIRLMAGVYGQGGELPGVGIADQTASAGVIGVGDLGVAALSDAGVGLYAATGTTDRYGYAIFGQAGGSEVATGVMGFAGSSGDAVLGSGGFGAGVRGTSDPGPGVLGESYGEPLPDGQSGDVGYGVSGFSDAGTGVYGASDSGTGVHGVSSSANGTEGVTFGEGYGVYGLHFSPDSGSGVFGESVLGSGIEGYTFSKDRDVAAVRGQNVGGYAGLFVGDVNVTGALTKSGGGFRVDHPADPETKYLSHSFVESPDMMNVYSGTVSTDDHGNARVQLPDYFEALNRDFRYQLTAIGQFAQLMVSQEINRNEFAIRSDIPHVKVCWQVTGVRQDAWAQAHRMPVEEDKPPAEKGRFLHPELFAGKDGVHRSDRRPAGAVTASLPGHLRPRAEQLLAALPPIGAAETSDLTELRSERRGWMAQRASDGRARLREQRHRANQMLERLRPGTSQ
jgi:hypothetical protein